MSERVLSLKAGRQNPNFQTAKLHFYSLLCNLFVPLQSWGALSKIVPTKSGQTHARPFVIDSLSATTKDFLQGLHHSDEIRHYISDCELFTRIMNSEEVWNEDSSDQLCGVS